MFRVLSVPFREAATGTYSHTQFNYNTGGKGGDSGEDDSDEDSEEEEEEEEGEGEGRGGAGDESEFFPMTDKARQLAIEFGIYDLEERMERAQRAVHRARAERQAIMEEEESVSAAHLDHE